MKPLLSIIIPCLDEEENVENVLNSVTELLINSGINYEIIVVDDQSTDATLQRAEKWAISRPDCRIRVIHKELHRRGYGAVVKYGLAFANGEYVIFVAADLVDPISLIPKMYSELQHDCDIVQVSRYLEKANSNTIPFSYKFFQFFYRIGVRVALGRRIPDSTYAFKMFKRSKILAMGVASNRFNISPVTCPRIFRPNAFRDNDSFNLRSRYEESTVFRRTDCSDITRGRSFTNSRGC